MEQWVHRVRTYSSQYNDTNWAANQVIGAPKVYPKYGDHHGAWAQGRRDANEFIEVNEKSTISIIVLFSLFFFRKYFQIFIRILAEYEQR